MKSILGCLLLLAGLAQASDEVFSLSLIHI